MGNILIADMVYHAAERRNAGTRADQEQVFVEVFIFQGEDALGAAKVSSEPTLISLNRYFVPAPPSSSTMTNSNTFVPSGQLAME